MVFDPCNHCNGNGKIPDGRKAPWNDFYKCGDCGGTGLHTPEKITEVEFTFKVKVIHYSDEGLELAKEQLLKKMDVPYIAHLSIPHGYHIKINGKIKEVK